MKGEIESMRRELKEREKKWRAEREEKRRSLEDLERKGIEMEKREKKEREAKGWHEDTGEGSVERRIREVEMKIEMKERERKRRNILIKGMEVREERRKEMEETMERIRAKVSVEEVRRIGGDKEKDRETVLVRLENEEQRREVLMKKSNLKGRRERIMEDWMWKKRRMRWRFEEIARKEESAGRKVRIGYGKIRIGNSWWKWDEEKEVLRDEKECERGKTGGRSRNGRDRQRVESRGGQEE